MIQGLSLELINPLASSNNIALFIQLNNCARPWCTLFFSQNMNNDAFEKLEDDEGIEEEEVEVEAESSQASPLQVGSKDMCSRTSRLCEFARMR